MQRDVRALMDGALGGIVGTATMSAVMLLAGRAGVMGGQPPELITEAALGRVGLRGGSEAARDRASVVVHFGFGIVTGALFGVLHRRLRLPVPGAVHGAVFGTIVWAVSYMGWVPALGIMPPAERDRRGRPEAMVFAHWVYGATLGTVVHRRAPRGAEAE